MEVAVCMRVMHLSLRWEQLWDKVRHAGMDRYKK